MTTAAPSPAAAAEQQISEGLSLSVIFSSNPPKIKVSFIPKQLPAQLTKQDIHCMEYFVSRRLSVEHC